MGKDLEYDCTLLCWGKTRISFACVVRLMGNDHRMGFPNSERNYPEEGQGLYVHPSQHIVHVTPTSRAAGARLSPGTHLQIKGRVPTIQRNRAMLPIPCD
ncbi:hypothetical protein PoB_006156900 [Plakobranchus ocellatus]|uniref:Galectin n=1 Tax=Plakobranchus ocellatus TaxID=259542 RepID=A0AAV4CT68_9GAST|nr:hypothetical protein PoB_006156900 [Plakobranchus ocellatus]